jgi:hypothetical protein
VQVRGLADGLRQAFSASSGTPSASS